MHNKEMEELKKLVRKWQKILRLEDWDINIRVLRSGQLADRNVAEILRHPKHGIALITLADPIDLDNLNRDEIKLGDDSDMESHIVHELLHITTDTWEPKEGLENDLKELALNRLGTALLKLDRRNK